MSKGEAKVLAESYRSALRRALSSSDPSVLLALRGEIQVVARWLEAHGLEDAKRFADKALDDLTRFYQFSQEVGGFTASNRAARTASVFDLASVGILAAENVLSAEKPSLMRFLMSGLSEGLMFVASRQYVAGSQAVLAATFRTHALVVEDALWSLALDLRNLEEIDAIREARVSIDDLFGKLDHPGVPVGTKVVLLQQLYGLVAIIRCARLLDTLRSVPGSARKIDI